MPNPISIKDIYIGKPDAKDEINFDGIEGFVNSYVMPDSFDVNSLMNGTPCFITGYKGIGKTALLFYLEYLIKLEDRDSCCSFVFFKEEFTETKKHELEGFSKRILSSVSIEPNALINNTDFEYIWRWLLFKRIVSDNEEFNNGIFEEDDNWERFSKVVKRIKAPHDLKKSRILPKIKLGFPVKDMVSMTEYSSEIEVDLQGNKQESNLSQFIDTIDEAEKYFALLKRTDIPYYILIDELEAYCGDEGVFTRDLYFIRDLIFTVKRFNQHLAQHKKTKIICSVRSEIINAISRFITTKELNKVINGFEAPLNWNYSNTTAYTHPIIQIVLKRIYMSQHVLGFDIPSNMYKEIYEAWFPEKIHDIEPANYILNNSWSKPRDIVRFLQTAKNSIKSAEKYFSQSVFNSIRKKYSQESLIEIREELRALYSPKDIDIIISCFTGFRVSFSYKKLAQRVEEYYKGTILEKDLIQVLNDLYRLGFVGNYLPSAKTYRWQHRGDDGIVLSDEWRIMIHQALQGALSLTTNQDIAVSKSEWLEKGDMVLAKVVSIYQTHILMDINHYGRTYRGDIRVYNLEKDISEIEVGDEFRAMVLGYNPRYKSYNLSTKYENS